MSSAAIISSATTAFARFALIPAAVLFPSAYEKTPEVDQEYDDVEHQQGNVHRQHLAGTEVQINDQYKYEDVACQAEQ
jgi:hypothetical protein